MTANLRQVGGSHYKEMGIEHWDVVALTDLDYFQGQITKYVMRWRTKNGIQDLEKAAHFLEKYIEVEKLRKEGNLTRYILLNIMEKLDLAPDNEAPDETDDEAIAGADKVLRALSSVPPDTKENAARRVCPECISVLPTHREGCTLALTGAECELCGGLETHRATCPNQR